MCGRYLIEIDEKELKEILSAAEVSADERLDQLSFTFSGGEIFPGSSAPVITAGGVRYMTWGFPSISESLNPHTPQGVISSRARPGIHLINARSETAATSKTFGEAFDARRCVVPASAYFEWKQTGKKRKVKYEITLPMRAPLYMAGIYTINGQFAILTRDAAPVIAEIHDRMPVIMPKSLIDAWLKQSPDALNQAVTDLQFAPVPASDKNPNQLKLFT